MMSLESKKTFVITSGIAALILLLALALVMLMQKNTPSHLQAYAAPKTPPPVENTQVHAVVRTPDMNTIQQSVTVARKTH